MTSEQLQAFQEGAAGKFGAGDTAILFGSLLFVIALLWFSWTAIRTYQGFAKGDLTSNEAGGVILRSVFLLTVILTLISVS